MAKRDAPLEPNVDHGAFPEVSSENFAQIDSVMNIITNTLERIKISFLLPNIFENPLTLRQHLAGTKYEQCLREVEKYLKDKKMEKQPIDKMDSRLLKLIDLFHENSDMIKELPNWLGDLNQTDKRLLDAFNTLCEITSQRMMKSAKSELSKEKRLQNIYRENENAKKGIKDINIKIHSLRINQLWKAAAKEAVMRKLEEDLEFKKWSNNNFIKQENAKSAIFIRGINASSVIKQREYEETLNKIKAQYEKDLRNNLKHEKEARDDRGKLLHQLILLNKKFDQTISEKVKENMFLQKVYDKAKEEFDVFLLEYKREEEAYETFIREKDEEERNKHEKRVRDFTQNRAARRIQRYWRSYRRRVKGKQPKGTQTAKGKKK